MLQSRNFWAAVVLLSVFWPVAWFLPLDWLFDIMNSLAIAACVALVIVYGPGLRHFLMQDDRTRVNRGRDVMDRSASYR